MQRKRDGYVGSMRYPGPDMAPPVRHAARRRVSVGGVADADPKTFSESASMQTARVNATAWKANNRSFAWDHLKLAHTLLDPEALEIFRSSAVGELTAVELSRRSGMSVGQCYRRLRRLESLGLLLSRKDRPAGRGGPTRRYRSALHSISVSLDEDQIRTRIEVNGGATPLISESTTTIEPFEPASASEAGADGDEVRADLVQLVEPRKTKRDSRKLPINLPAFLEEPLSRLLERR
jgi:DNA-binding transcriptional ArsR family regulator